MMFTDPIAARISPTAEATLATNPNSKLEKLHAACVDFEAMLTQQMLQSMQSTLKDGSLVGEGLSGSIYSSILSQGVAKAMAEGRSVGLANQLFNDMVRCDPELKESFDKFKSEQTARLEKVQKKNPSNLPPLEQPPPPSETEQDLSKTLQNRGIKVETDVSASELFRIYNRSR
ncbi:MAG: rod-binding protein [Verrucomicrobiae bacterium]|nr:rod-binding protein [Verrucomicrobiae bacterium]